MASATTTSTTVIAHRSSGNADVTLVWERCDGADKTVVCVADRQRGAYFEIPAEPYLALDVYYHPYFYRDFSTVDYEGRRLTA